MLRLAVISSPRSGNTWLREMIAALYGLEQIPVHFPEDIPWDNLPNRCITQIHWNPEPEFTTLLDRAGFRVIAIGRHLFDILMSYLNYVYYVHQEGICPGGGACEECVIVGRSPQSREFRDYVASDRAALLFGYTPRWWNRPGVIQFRYEELVADAATHLRNLAAQLGESPVRGIAEVMEATSIERMKPRRDAWQYHFWQGRPGLWRTMIPADEAVWLAEQRREYFEIVGYPVDPDPTLQPLQADLNWLHLQLDSTREFLGLERSKHRALIAESKELRQQFRIAQNHSAEQDTVYGETHAELLRYQNAFLDTRGQLLGKQRELDATTQRLDATYQAHVSTYRQLEAAQLELRAAGHELQTVREELQRTSHALDETRLRLDEARQRQLPLDELGSRGLKWALRVLRLYRRAKSVLPSSAPVANASSGARPPQFVRLARRRSHTERVEN
jgi:hypothetical protein